jgi:NTP pyrophosphatase (non-canonical NTP hydrolase)
MIDLVKTQEEIREWSGRNFPKNTADEPLFGVGEEFGELCHAHLKLKQGIRVGEDHHAAKVDAIGDLCIYLMDYCNRSGISLSDAIGITWAKVKERDWQKHKIDGTK